MAVIISDTEYGAARATLEHHRVKGWLTEAEYNARLAELDEAYITGLEEERGYGNRQYRMQQFERMEEAQRRMREAIGKRDCFGVKLMEKGRHRRLRDRPYGEWRDNAEDHPVTA